MTKTLISPEDEPSPTEEAIVAKMKANNDKAYEAIRRSLVNSALRSRGYAWTVNYSSNMEKVKASARSLEIERMVQERLLHDAMLVPQFRRAVMTPEHVAHVEASLAAMP